MNNNASATCQCGHGKEAHVAFGCIFVAEGDTDYCDCYRYTSQADRPQVTTQRLDDFPVFCDVCEEDEYSCKCTVELLARIEKLVAARTPDPAAIVEDFVRAVRDEFEQFENVPGIKDDDLRVHIVRTCKAKLNTVYREKFGKEI
jgi:hypothetical protein